MLRSRRASLILSLAFILVEVALGVAIQFTSKTAYTVLCYSSVVISCLFCLLWFTKSAEYTFTQAGLIFTVISDLFLVVIEPMMQLVAIIFFTMAQLCYFARIYSEESRIKARRVHLGVRLTLSLVAIAATFIVLGKAADALALVSIFYYANLISNIIFAFGKARISLLFPLGLVFFALCDAQIGFKVLIENYITVSDDSFLNALVYPGFNFAWLCYVPSQTLIALSLVELRLKKKNSV